MGQRQTTTRRLIAVARVPLVVGGSVVALLPLLVALMLAGSGTGDADGHGGSSAAASRAPAPAAAYRALAPVAVSKPSVVYWRNGSWCWFADPRAVRVSGRYDQIFVGWITWSGAVTIGEFDPYFGARRTAVVGHLFHDDHGSPAIYVEPDKRLTVFFSAHNGKTLYERTTLQPENISAWGPLQRVPAHIPGDLGFTYPNPVSLSAENNRLYLFWRGASWSQDYATRTAAGVWTRGRPVITNPPQRPYVKVGSDGVDTIALAYTDGHPRNLMSSIYYVAYKHGWLRHASGRPIRQMGTAPITPAQGDVIFDGPAHGYSGWVWDVALSPRGRPVVVYATFQNLANHAYWYAVWTGTRWVSHFMTYAGPSISPSTIEQQYSGGIALDHSNPSIVYLSRKVNGWFEIERWVTTNGGVSWSHTTVARHPGQDDVRPVVTRGADTGPMSVLWLQGHYGSYTTYRTKIAYLN
jgi:hypothetical protein